MSYAKVRVSGSDIHLYLQESKQIPALIQTEYGKRSKLSQMKSIDSKIKIEAMINCSFFNGLQVLGRNQGERYNNTLNQKPPKKHYDYVITKDGQHHIGLFESWDHQHTALLGFSVGAVMIKDSLDCELISDEFDVGAVLTKKEPSTAFGVLENGLSFMVVVEGRNTNDAGMNAVQIRTFIRRYYPSVKNLVILDRGGSSEMVVGGLVKNYLSDRVERLMCNGLAFTTLDKTVRYRVVSGEFNTYAEALKYKQELEKKGIVSIISQL
jgi:exopolysaccharide biosynthesis protein